MAYPAVAAEKVDARIAFSLEQTGCDELQLKTEQRKALSAVLNKKYTVVFSLVSLSADKLSVASFANSIWKTIFASHVTSEPRLDMPTQIAFDSLYREQSVMLGTIQFTPACPAMVLSHGSI